MIRSRKAPGRSTDGIGRRGYHIRRHVSLGWCALGLTIAGLSLGACANLNMPNNGAAGRNGTAAAPIPITEFLPPRPVSKTLQFVATASAGQSANLVDPSLNGAVTVRVIKTYSAASGRPCKEFSVTDRDQKIAIHVACAAADGWVEARPLLVGEGNPGTAMGSR